MNQIKYKSNKEIRKIKIKKKLKQKIKKEEENKEENKLGI